MHPPTEQTANVPEALRDCLAASRKLVHGRLELLEYDLKDNVEQTLRRSARFGVAGLFAFAGASALTLAAGLKLSAVLSPASAAAILGLVHLSIAALLFWPRLRPPLPRAAGVGQGGASKTEDL